MQEQAPTDQIAEPTDLLDMETLGALEEGIRSEESERTYTWEEVKKFARERRKAWMTIPANLIS